MQKKYKIFIDIKIIVDISEIKSFELFSQKNFHLYPSLSLVGGVTTTYKFFLDLYLFIKDSEKEVINCNLFSSELLLSDYLFHNHTFYSDIYFIEKVYFEKKVF